MPRKDTEMQPSEKPEIKGKKVSWKLIFFIFAFITLWTIYHNKDLIIPLLQKNHFLWSVYSFILLQIEQKSLLGLAFLSFTGALFFVFLPVELIFIYYLSLGYNKLLMLLIVLSCYMAGLILNYFIGFLFGKKILKKKKDPEKLQRRINKFGTFIIILGYLFFFPMQFITAALGAFRYPFKKFFIFSFIMLSIKFVFIVFAGNYFIAEILPKIKAFF